MASLERESIEKHIDTAITLSIGYSGIYPPDTYDLLKILYLYNVILNYQLCMLSM